MPQVGFEPTIPVLERAETVQALDRVATVIGSACFIAVKFSKLRLDLGLWLGSLQ
jgi:hypothetical protein